jgi:acetylornithine deacetylase/succinyl-diaminopimelate desuccinylase-like protein
MMRAAGIQDAKIDEEANVLALRKGTHSDGKVVVVSAHLDTVFPEGTDAWMEVDMRSESMPDLTTDLVQYAKAAIEAGGYKVNTQWSSTDSNMPMSLGIPAITIGRGAPDKSGRSHSLDEWMDVEKEPMVKAVNTALSIVLAVTGME